MSGERFIDFKVSPERLEMVGAGAWTAVNASELEAQIDSAERHGARQVDMPALPGAHAFSRLAIA